MPWYNPTVSEIGVTTSVASQFDDFLNRSGQLGSLQFGSGILSSNKRRVMLVEEFPTIMARSSNALESFRSVIVTYLASCSQSQTALYGSKHSNDDHPPVVMIISETLLSSSTALSDSFTAHRLLGPEIVNHPLVTSIDFNSVAPTFVAKALDLVINKEARDSKRRRTPGPAVLQKLAEVGDIRSAVNSLEFLCARSDQNSDWSGTVAAKTKKRAKDAIPLTEMEKQALQLISQRETTLDMFHAAGKVVYNKRDHPGVLDMRAEPPPKPPDHLMHLYTPKVSQVDVEALLGETGTDIQTFISTLHENYVLSCNGDSLLDAFDGCAEALSDSDILSPDSRHLIRLRASGTQRFQTNVQTGGTDMLRQDEIGFHIAVRGLLSSLPYPVNRSAPANGRRSDAFKMFYPASLRLWKIAEEIDGLISVFLHDLSQDGHVLSRTSDGNGVAAWKSRGSIFTTQPQSTGDEGAEVMRQHSSKDSLVLEVLPFLTKIRSARQQDARVVGKITQFSGLHISDSEPFEDEPLNDNVVQNPQPHRAEAPAPPKAVDPIFLRLSKVQATESDIEKMYISDDDIMDD